MGEGGVRPVDGGVEGERGGGEPGGDAVMGEIVAFAAARRRSSSCSAASLAALAALVSTLGGPALLDVAFFGGMMALAGAGEV